MISARKQSARATARNSSRGLRTEVGSVASCVSSLRQSLAQIAPAAEILDKELQDRHRVSPPDASAKSLVKQSPLGEQ